MRIVPEFGPKHRTPVGWEKVWVDNLSPFLRSYLLLFLSPSPLSAILSSFGSLALFTIRSAFDPLMDTSQGVWVVGGADDPEVPGIWWVISGSRWNCLALKCGNLEARFVIHHAERTTAHGNAIHHQLMMFVPHFRPLHSTRFTEVLMLIPTSTAYIPLLFLSSQW